MKEKTWSENDIMVGIMVRKLPEYWVKKSKPSSYAKEGQNPLFTRKVCQKNPWFTHKVQNLRETQLQLYLRITWKVMRKDFRRKTKVTRMPNLYA